MAIFILRICMCHISRNWNRGSYFFIYFFASLALPIVLVHRPYCQCAAMQAWWLQLIAIVGSTVPLHWKSFFKKTTVLQVHTVFSYSLYQFQGMQVCSYKPLKQFNHVWRISFISSFLPLRYLANKSQQVAYYMVVFALKTK